MFQSALNSAEVSHCTQDASTLASNSTVQVNGATLTTLVLNDFPCGLCPRVAGSIPQQGFSIQYAAPELLKVCVSLLVLAGVQKNPLEQLQCSNFVPPIDD
jgi:hypothetical protein